METMTKTLNNFLPTIVKDRINREGLWSYSVFAPSSLDDEATVVAVVIFGMWRPMGNARVTWDIASQATEVTMQ